MLQHKRSLKVKSGENLLKEIWHPISVLQHLLSSSRGLYIGLTKPLQGRQRRKVIVGEMLHYIYCCQGSYTYIEKIHH